MSLTDVLPLLVLVLLLVAIGGGDPGSMSVVFEGDRTVDELDDAFVVAGGTVTVPANATPSGDVYVVGGDLRIEGAVAGDVTVLTGNVSVLDGGGVAGDLQTLGGSVSLAPGSSVESVTRFDVTPEPRSPLASLGYLVGQMLALGLAGALLTRRAPALVGNVADSVSHHPVVSGVVGSLAGATLLVLFVYMAFTLVLLPVSLVGLFLLLLTVLYGYVGIGSLLGRYVPVERPAVANGVGVAGFVLLVELLGSVPVLGAVGQFLLVAVGLGAVLVTYFGYREFEPVDIPG